MSITAEAALSALEKVNDPELARPLADIGMVRDITAAGGAVELTVSLRSPRANYKARLEEDVTRALRAAGAANVKIHWELAIPTRNILSDDPCLGVKNIVLVMSGKGGVGKSTVAANLTVA